MIFSHYSDILTFTFSAKTVRVVDGRVTFNITSAIAGYQQYYICYDHGYFSCSAESERFSINYTPASFVISPTQFDRYCRNLLLKLLIHYNLDTLRMPHKQST